MPSQVLEVGITIFPVSLFDEWFTHFLYDVTPIGVKLNNRKGRSSVLDIGHAVVGPPDINALDRRQPGTIAFGPFALQ